MKAILEFNLPDDQEDFKMATNALSWYAVCWDLDQELRAKTKYAPGIMGPFGYLPMMECYHGVVNVFHETYGSFEFTAESTDTIDLNNGSGYIEKDHGYNFPKSWIWIQSNCFKKHLMYLNKL